jgi:hypothetical protein
VGVSNAVAIADAFVQRPASARRWSETTVATVFVQRPPTSRPCATIAVFPLQVRFSNHGWLTPAAPGCTHAGRCRKAVAIYNTGPSSSNNSHRRRISSQICGCDLQRRFVSHGGAYAPRSCCRANVCRRKNDFCDARTHIRKSGGRQPAVGVSNAVAVADAFVQRPASAHCWSETTVATATRWISTMQVCIPRTSHGGLTPPALVGVRTFVGGKTIFAMHERRFTRAAGVSPPWVCDTNAVREEWSVVPGRPNQQPRAAGVSPPWV